MVLITVDTTSTQLKCLMGSSGWQLTHYQWAAASWSPPFMMDTTTWWVAVARVPLCSTLPCSPLLTRLPSFLLPHPPTLTSPQSGRHSQTPHTSAPALPYLEGHWWLLVVTGLNPPYTSTPLSPSHGWQLERCLWECAIPALSHCPLERWWSSEDGLGIHPAHHLCTRLVSNCSNLIWHHHMYCAYVFTKSLLTSNT